MSDERDRYFLSAAVQLCHKEIEFAISLADGLALASGDPSAVLFVDAELADADVLSDPEIAPRSPSGRLTVPLVGIVSGDDQSQAQARLIEQASALLLRP